MNKYNVKYKYYSVIIKIIVWIIYASLTWFLRVFLPLAEVLRNMNLNTCAVD